MFQRLRWDAFIENVYSEFSFEFCTKRGKEKFTKQLLKKKKAAIIFYNSEYGNYNRKKKREEES